MQYKIKNMVCSRCIRLLEQELKLKKLPKFNVRLGEVDFDKYLNKDELAQFDLVLDDLKFSRITTKNASLIENIKHILIQFVYHNPNWDNFKLSDFLTKKLDIEYKKMSSIFSQVESITIEKFLIRHKIERAKELIIYDEMNLTEIAYELGYSSSQHFSKQFQSQIGMSPTEFKKSITKSRKKLDDIY